MDWQNLVTIALGAILINNFIFSQFLGICPFMGVSKSTDTALGMGLAVTFVMGLASAVCYPINKYILVNPALFPDGKNLAFMQTIVYILVIASLVQFIEMFLQKGMPSLYTALGVYLPLITTNCAVLGVAILMIQKEFDLLQSFTYSVATAVGFGLALVIFAGIRERLELDGVPAALKGTPVALITAAILAMAFMGFSGLV